MHISERKANSPPPSHCQVKMSLHQAVHLRFYPSEFASRLRSLHCRLARNLSANAPRQRPNRTERRWQLYVSTMDASARSILESLLAMSATGISRASECTSCLQVVSATSSTVRTKGNASGGSSAMVQRFGVDELRTRAANLLVTIQIRWP